MPSASPNAKRFSIIDASIKKAWELLVVRPTNRGSSTAYCSRTDNVRAHADMNIRYQNGELILWGTSLHWLRHSHTHGHLPLLSSRQDWKFCENFDESQTERQVNAFICLVFCPPNRIIMSDCSSMNLLGVCSSI